MDNQQANAESQEKSKEKSKTRENVVFVGSKPFANYIRAVTNQFIKENATAVTIKSRGKFISKAVDIAEVTRRSLQEKKAYIQSINIASETFETDGKKTNISTMDIVLARH